MLVDIGKSFEELAGVCDCTLILRVEISCFSQLIDLFVVLESQVVAVAGNAAFFSFLAG